MSYTDGIMKLQALVHVRHGAHAIHRGARLPRSRGMGGAPPKGMATRMTTLLFGSERGQIDTPPLPINAPASRVSAGDDQVAVADTELMPSRPMMSTAPRWNESVPSIPPIMRRPFPAFPAMTAGLLSTAALFLGLAMFVIAVTHPMSDFARAALSLTGTSMMAAVIAFMMSSRPEYA